MDFSSKKCCIDRLSSLPDELLSQILSPLPTKDVVIASLSFKKMRSAITCLTALDFDDSPISYCAMNNPQLTERFQIFRAFVDNILQTSQSPHLSKFRLGFGGDVTVSSRHYHNWSNDCGEHCFPDFESTKLDAWINFPLSRCGVREIDLRIYVSKSGKLPSALFTCETLEVLKLDTNLDFQLVSSMPSFRLPNLKVLQLCSLVILDDDFVGWLLSNCPLLQELDLDCWWKYGKSVTISSPLLQKLVLSMNRDYQSGDSGDVLNIDTPNLQYFEYYDLLAVHNSVASIKAPVKASIEVFCKLETVQECLRGMLNLLGAVCNVQHLHLSSSTVEALDHDELKNQLPMFDNLKHLVLDYVSNRRWDDTVLFEFLMHSPILETLEFPKGIDTIYALTPDREYHPETVEWDRWLSRKNQVNPYCCKSHLKRIIIKKYRGTKRELELVRFLLENAPVLEEFSVMCKVDGGVFQYKVDPSLAETALKKLPMASSTCLMTVQ